MDSPARASQPPSEASEIAQEKPVWRGYERYKRKRPRSLVPYDNGVGKLYLFTRAMRWLLPWTMADYPGRQRGIVEALGGRYTLETCRAWLRGNVPMSRVAAGVLADHVEARCKVGMALVEELNAYAAREKARQKRRGVGFRAIDPQTGMDKRGGRVGRKRTKEL